MVGPGLVSGCPPLSTTILILPGFYIHRQWYHLLSVAPAAGLLSEPAPRVFQILGMAFSMTLFQHIHRTGKKYDA